jgi:hypothetical protein
MYSAGVVIVIYIEVVRSASGSGRTITSYNASDYWYHWPEKLGVKKYNTNAEKQTTRQVA